MFNKKGMILLETLLFFMIILLMIFLLTPLVSTTQKIENIEERGYFDDETRIIQQP